MTRPGSIEGEVEAELSTDETDETDLACRPALQMVDHGRDACMAPSPRLETAVATHVQHTAWARSWSGSLCLSTSVGQRGIWRGAHFYHLRPLVRLWMAHHYIVSSASGDSLVRCGPAGAAARTPSANRREREMTFVGNMRGRVRHVGCCPPGRPGARHRLCARAARTPTAFYCGILRA